MKTLLAVGAVLLGAALAAAVLLFAGFYNVAATRQHVAPIYWLFETGLYESIKRGARGIVVPPLGDRALAERGLTQYREHCLRCHGAPGVPPAPFALGMIPAPANLAHTARSWAPAELYWTVKYGIKMSGMPAWEYRLSDGEIWAIVAFLRELPLLSPADYRAMADRAGHVQSVDAAAGVPDAAPGVPDATRGKAALVQYACLTCHRIPGVVGPNAPVGPPLEGIGTREYIAGVLPNTPENMVRWLRVPQAVNPRSAMPDLGLSERDARDIAAYLYTLR